MSFSLAGAKPFENNNAPIISLYGTEGVGKTTFSLEAPSAFYIPTAGERPPAGLQPSTPGVVRSYWDMIDILEELRDKPHPYKWVVIDSVDGFEPLVWAETCRVKGWDTIETPGFGKGYLAADEEWQRFVNLLDEVRIEGMGVIMLAHYHIVRFDSPSSEPYNRYTLKLQPRASKMIREQSDIVAFMTTKVNIREKEINRNKSVNHVEGGKTREIGFNLAAAYDAKNRYDMPEVITYKKGKGFDEISKYFPPAIGVRQ